MESSSQTFREGNRITNVTINHYHNNEVTPFQQLGGLMTQMLLMSSMTEMLPPLLGNNEEENLKPALIEDDGMEVEYEIHDDHVGKFKIMNLVSSKEKEIPIIRISFENKSNLIGRIIDYPNEFRQSIQNKLAVIGAKTNIFLVNTKQEKIDQKLLFTDNNFCECVMTKFDKNNKKFVVFSDKIAQKLGFEFYELMKSGMIEYVLELNKIYKIEHLKNDKYKMIEM